MGGLGPQVLLLLPLLPQFQGMREVGVVEGVERGGGHNPTPALPPPFFPPTAPSAGARAPSVRLSPQTAIAYTTARSIAAARKWVKGGG